MTSLRSISRVATGFLASAAVAFGVMLAGCSSETISASSAKSSKETYAKEVNQAARGANGGKAIVTRSVKGLIKKDAVKD
jgi:hypothetical protein